MKQVKIAVLALLCALLCACGRQGDLTAKAVTVAQSCAAIAWKLAAMRPAEAEAAPEEIERAPEEAGDEAEPVPEEFLEVLLRSADRNYNLAAYYHPIEQAYLQEGRELVWTNAGVGEFYEKYAGLWAEDCAACQAKIEAALAGHDDALAAFQASQAGWEAQLEAAMDACYEMRTAAYTTGSIVSSLLPKHRMELWRARAMELLAIYLDTQYSFGEDPQIDWLVPSRYEFFRWETDSAEAAPEEVEDEAFDGEFAEMLVKSADWNSRLAGYYHPIEMAYLEEGRTLSGTTSEQVEFNAKYIALWSEECAAYQAKIEESLADSEAALAAFQAAQAGWEAQLKAEMDARYEIRAAAHEGGTIMGPLMGQHCLELWRARAMELIDLYLDVQYEFRLDPEIDWLPPAP